MRRGSLVQILINRAPLLPVIFSVIIGLVLAVQSGVVFWVTIACVVLLCSYLAIRGKSYLLISVAGGTLAGCAAMAVDDYINSCNVSLGEKSDVIGTIERVSESEHSFRLLLSLDGNLEGTAYVTVTNPDYGLRVGDVIRFNTTFQAPEIRKDVSEQETLERFFFLNHVGCTALVNGSHIEIIGKNKSLKYRLLRLRESIVDVIACTSLSPQAQGLLATLLVGDDSMLVDGSRERYSGAGVAHVLALSGMHIAVLVLIGAWLLYPLSVLGYHRFRWLLLIIALWLYAVMTGSSPSVIRAVLMFTLIILARYSGHRHSSLNALCFAALLILVLSPRSLFSAGFQLTFIATASLICLPVIVGVNFKKPWRGIGGKLLRWIWFYLIFTLSATVGSTLLSVYWFHKVPLYFLLSNIPCNILLPPVLGLGLLIIALHAVGIEWGILTVIEDTLCNFIDRTVAAVDGFPLHVIDGVYISGLQVAVGYAALAVLAWGIYNRKMLSILAPIVVILLIPYYQVTKTVEDKLFIARTSRASTIVYTHGREAFAFTTAPIVERTGMEDELRNYYRKFFELRGIDSVRLLNGGTVKNGLLKAGDYSILVVNDNEIDSLSAETDYLLVGSGFKGDIVGLAERMPGDTILLGSDINGRRRRRYLRELTEAGMPARDLGGNYGLELILH